MTAPRGRDEYRGSVNVECVVYDDDEGTRAPLLWTSGWCEATSLHRGRGQTRRSIEDSTLRASRRPVPRCVVAPPGSVCGTPAYELPRASSRFRYGTAIRDGSATRGMVHTLGERSKSVSVRVSERIPGERETREVYLAGGRLSPSESLAVARHSARDSDGMTADRVPFGVRSRCCCGPPTGRAPWLTTGRSSERSSCGCRRRTSPWRSPRSATGLPRAPCGRRSSCRSTRRSRASDDASECARRPRRLWAAGPAGRHCHGHCGTLRAVAFGSLTPESLVRS